MIKKNYYFWDRTIYQIYGIALHVFISTKSHHCRKPNTGMWEEFFGNKEIDLTKSFYVGDAAGRTLKPPTSKRFLLW